jgi:hypothetical protein
LPEGSSDALCPARTQTGALVRPRGRVVRWSVLGLRIRKAHAPSAVYSSEMETRNGRSLAVR